ncbi:hypothetical protein [Johnsonella ignava]|uniref:hypothetical protein n=1 Tax=Johnsonella ignava TaxID=43995 RepID=UPI0023F266F0|nr:hypothetical protein [Johnsonella ignava]
MYRKTAGILMTAALALALSVNVMAARSIGGGAGIRQRQASARGANSRKNSTSGAVSPSSAITIIYTGDGKQVSFITGDAATAGLPAEVTAVIKKLNDGITLKDAVGIAGLEGFNALTKTDAIAVRDTKGTISDTDTRLRINIPNLAGNLGSIKILYYANATGRWAILDTSSVDVENKNLSFTAPGSGTFTVIYKK